MGSSRAWGSPLDYLQGERWLLAEFNSVEDPVLRHALRAHQSVIAAMWAAKATMRLTDRQVAEEAGVPRTTLSAMLNGRTWPSSASLHSVACVLGIHVGPISTRHVQAPGRPLRVEPPSSTPPNTSRAKRH